MITWIPNWALMIIFFNVPIRLDKEYTRKAYPYYANYQSATLQLASYGWDEVHCSFSIFGMYIAWYEHDKF